MRLFSLGRLVATPGALEFLVAKGLTPVELWERHQRNDSDSCPQDLRENEWSVSNGARIFSTFKIDGETIFVITEADRSSTCILLASEY